MGRIELDEGYFFGLGVFETIAIEQGKPVFLEAHLKRLEASRQALHIENRVEPEEAVSYLEEHPMERGVLKIVLSEKNKIFTQRENHYREEQYEKGFALDFSQVRRNETSLLTYHKTLNYGDCILEKRKAAAMGVDELIFLNTKGQICEGTTANIFFVRQGRIVAPPASCGMLSGILRAFVYERMQVEEEMVRPEDLDRFEECFVTNSLLGIMPVRSFGNRKFESRRLSEELREQYRRIIEERI